MKGARRSLVRIFALAAKELLHIRRDPRTLMLALALPVAMLLLFGYGVSFDIDHMPMGLVDRDRTASSRRLAHAFEGSREFDLAPIAEEQLEPRFRRGELLAALFIPEGYERDLSAGRDVRLQLVVDAADAATANQLLAKAEGVLRADELRRAGDVTPPLEVRVFTRYNPEGRSAVFIVPGLAAYLMSIVAVLLTALTISGEWERGSMEQLFASSVGRLDIILGKLLPYLGLGLLQLLVVIAVGAAVFDVPIRGSPLLLLLVGTLFLAGMLGQGLLISVLAKNQLVATQAGSLSSLVPAMLLSGMVVPLENVPRVLLWLSYAVPARYLVHALRGVMLKGSGLSLLWPDLAALAVFAVVTLGIATARFRRRLA